MIILKQAHPAFLLTAVCAIAVASADANVIVNGDFETGDLTGWTQVNSGTTVSTTNPLAETYSAVQTQVNASVLSQSFAPFTTAATTSFIFSATDPGGAGDRSMNVNWRASNFVAGDPQINLRLVDLDADGDGDVQVFSGTGIGGTWVTVLTDAVTFGASTSLSLTINSRTRMRAHFNGTTAC